MLPEYVTGIYYRYIFSKIFSKEKQHVFNVFLKKKRSKQINLRKLINRQVILERRFVNMNVNNRQDDLEQDVTEQSYRYYSEDELQKCLERGTVTMNAILSLIEMNSQKEKTINELTETIHALSETVKKQSKQLKVLEEKMLKKAGRKREIFYYMCEELTDEKIIELINCGEFRTVGELEKEVGAKKNQLRNRYVRAKEKQMKERKLKKIGNN